MPTEPSPRLNTRQSLSLYLIVLGWSVLVFWFGVWFGSLERSVGPAPVEAADLVQEPIGRQPPLDFHTELARQPETVIDPLPSEAEAQSSAAPLEEAPDIPSEPEPQSSPIESFFTVQVAAVRSGAEARHEVLRLSAKGERGRVVPPGPGELYFRVWVGEFRSEEEAHRKEASLRQAGFSTYVRQGDGSTSQ